MALQSRGKSLVQLYGEETVIMLFGCLSAKSVAGQAVAASVSRDEERV